jgi:RimJ/RimL family protein N-acetyltransferase
MTFDAQPVLVGASIRLRPLRSHDFDALYAVASDPLIWEQHPVPNRHRVEVFREFFDQALDSRGALLVQTRGGAVIGSSRFHGFDPEHSEVEIGWTFLARSHWGGATNAELKSLMLDHAFRFVDRVVFHVGRENLRSQRALEKIGAVLIGSGLDGAGTRTVLFEIHRADWADRRRTLG